ncbi:helix-turn-helix domain-containing protein [Herminiimonas sp. CN]|uniref:helix-turn-helix domain-containing protein n=1 Tax=Herminiimonas sp. CN TaxID=1349818 RepID=UPI000473301B|nr:helix-turn-helix transcriptional regulator [Herminiimonas sp. CN]
MSVFAKRLKEARKIAGLSQEKLGVAAGIDEMSASARMNQYERGKHDPDYLTVTRIAKVLNVPEGYFYTVDDVAAWLAVIFHRASQSDKEVLIEAARSISEL